MRHVAFTLLMLMLLTGCGIQGRTPDDGTWVGTITTEGNLTTVVNESGSVWGGAATLVEEASIGVEEGEDAYMFGLVRSVAASDQYVFALDFSLGFVRVYTLDGEYVRDLGSKGDGPGEFRQPSIIGLSPEGNRVYVHDFGLRRLSVFSDQGNFLDSYFLPHDSVAHPIVTPEGTAYGPVVVDPDEAFWPRAYGMLAHGPDGPIGSPLIPPRIDSEIPNTDGGKSIAIPHMPQYVWAMAPSADLIAGVGGEYRFEILRPDGSKMVVHAPHDPVPVLPEERDAAITKTSTFMRMARGDSWRWNGPEVPWIKPAFAKFLPTESGELWVIRPGPGQRVERPVGDAVWRDTHTVDVFGGDGRLLGSVPLPDGTGLWVRMFVEGEGQPFAFVRDDLLVMPIEDEAGTIMVKRYRLVLPGE